MQQSVQTVLTGYTTKSGTGQFGAWTLHLYTAQDGTKFQTNKIAVANAASALMNQPVVIAYTQEQKGNYLNNVIESVSPANGAVAQPAQNGAAPQATTTTTVVAPSSDPAAPRIARSVAAEQFPEYVKAGIIAVPNTLGELYDALGGLARWIFSGSRPDAAAAAPSSSGAVVGQPTGAVQTAPVEAAPQPVAAPTTADDDIPF